MPNAGSPKRLTHRSMLEVILYPVQGRSVGEGSFNREVDICERTFEGKKHMKWQLATASSPQSKANQTKILPYWQFSQSCERKRKMLLDEGRAGWTHCGGDVGGGALCVLEESRWKFPQSEGRKLTRGLQWAESFVCFGCECGTWQRHLSLWEVKKTQCH